MRKNYLANVFIATSLMATGAVQADTVTVNGGTVHFTGEVVNAACAVSADSANQTVYLGQARTASFTDVGTLSKSVPFTIKLEDCDVKVSQSAAVAFSGTVDDTDSTLLATTKSSGAASGVGIQIADYQGKVLPPNGSTFSGAQTLYNGTNVLNFSARYKSTNKSVTPGPANSDATFTMQYN